MSLERAMLDSGKKMFLARLLAMPNEELTDDEIELMWILSFNSKTRAAILAKGEQVDQEGG